MPPPADAPHLLEAARAAAHVTELLEAAWGRAQETVTGSLPSPSQLRALLVIEEHQVTNLRNLGDALDSKAPSVSRLCDRMEAAGLIERSLSGTSRRELELRLTGRGQSLLDELRENRARELGAVMAAMAPADVRALTRGLQAFHQAVTRETGRTSGGGTARTA
ncbi:MarR family winged helix-turn-helix transcriptional regulator [Streptacidiphilus sp. N1-12]|uniref:MarR family winged helix-turn-helix transcriptional regulator n=2 Tax=Streptacidiphilus alkalitolerans TaxID=3342712 RepID=A0ABV6VKC6_9ACTN